MVPGFVFWSSEVHAFFGDLGVRLLPEWFVLTMDSMAGARSFTELHCWKLSNELKVGIYALIKAGEVGRDFEFCDQMGNAAAPAPRNIAEAFGRYRPRQLAQYPHVANGSLMETANNLRDGLDRGHFRPSDVEPLLILVKRASAATTRWIRHLETARAPEP